MAGARGMLDSVLAAGRCGANTLLDFTSIAAFLIIAASSYLQGAVGFGHALIAAPLLTLLDPSLVPGPVTASSIVLSMLVMWRERGADITPAHIEWTLAGRLPGSALGAVAVALIPETSLAIFVAVLVLVAVAISMSGLHPVIQRRSLLIAGVLSGFMGTSASTGGPPLALLYQHFPGPTLRAALAANFALGGVISLVALWIAGKYGSEQTGSSVLLSAAAVAGFAFSGRAARFFDAGRTRVAVLAISAVSALLVLVREL
ncbi:MAG TPA: sulfite exporter TauE/SafE family protein [Candidatus Binatia bacterium]|nr:sulfite exporter TauE/SafE family protein [Candidatus Binatia bacterium]